MSMQKNFLSVVNKAQNEEYCHKKLLKSIENSFDVNDLEEFLNVYSKALLHLYCSEYANKNPFVARGLEFLAKLAIKITLKCVKPVDITNPNGTLSQVYDVSTDQFFTNILKCSLKYALVDKPQVRFNTCYFIMVLLQNIGNNVELDYIVCNNILESLVELLDDPKVNVRLQALKALVRMQEPSNPECIVLNSFLVLFADANSEVRKAVISLVAPHPQSFAKIRERLNDTDIGVRQAAYTKWADTNPKLHLKIVDRNFILTCGFADSYNKIKLIITEKLLPKWLNAYGGNYLDLLKALKLDADENDIQNFEELCTKVMEVYLKNHPLSDIVKYLPINKEDKVIPVKQLHIESVLYWSILITFLRKTDDGEDYLVDILPELTPFSNYIERVVKEKSATSMDEWENLEYQNIILQLFTVASGFDMSDEVGRKTFYSLILQVLSTYKFQQKVIGVVIKVASQLNQNIHTFTTDMCQVISEIREPLVDDIPSEKQLRARNFEISQLKVNIHRLEIAEEGALKVKDFQHANIVHNEIKECQRKLENLTNMYSQSEKVRTSKDDPETICRCLDILIGLLQTPNIIRMSEALLTCKDEFLMPLINSNISDIHWRFILCLGLFSVIDKDTAFKHANFICLPIATYRAVPNYDKKALKISVACVTDLIRVYGVKVIGIEDTNSLVNQESNQPTNRRKLYSEDMNELRAVNKDDINIEFIIDIILDMLDDQDEDVRNTAATAISRLMAYDFPVNPELITRLILKWYNPLTVKRDTKLQQQVGFIITCFTDNVKGSRRIVEKAVIPIIASLANAPRNSPLLEVDIDNVLKFLSALTNISSTNLSENIHNSLATSVITKISNKPNDVCTPYFAKLLTYLNVGSDDTVSLKNMISSLEFILPDVLDKAPHKNLLKFINHLKTSMICISEESETTLGASRQISEFIETRSEGNVREISVDQDGTGFKSPSKSSSMSRISNVDEETREVPKRNLYLHEIGNNSNEVEENSEEKNRKGNSSESEEDAKIVDKSVVRKDNKKSRCSNRKHKQLSLMKLRRKSVNLSKNSLKDRQTLLKIPEETDSEQSSKTNVTEKKGHRGRKLKKTIEQDSKTMNENIWNSTNIDSSLHKDSSVFVKCDYTPLKNGAKKGQNSIYTKPLPNANKKLAKVITQTDSSGKTTPRQSSRLQKIKIISQVKLRTSETSINKSGPNSSEDKCGTKTKQQVTAQSVENSKSRRLNNMTNSSLENNVDHQFQNIPSTGEGTAQKTLRQRSTKQLSNDVRKSLKNSDQSPKVFLTALKLKDYATPSSSKTNRLDDSSQHSLDQTPLKKRVAKTPLSALGHRLTKKLLSENFVKSAPTKSSVNTRENSRLPRSSSEVAHFQRRATKESIRGKNDHSSASTPSRKRRFDTPNSLLKQKPNKIAKTISSADPNKKQINTMNTDIRTGTSGNKNRVNKDEKHKDTKEPTVKSTPKDIVQSLQSGSKFRELRSQRTILDEKSSSLERPNKERFRKSKKENHITSNNALNERSKLLIPLLVKVDINEIKKNADKLLKKIPRRSGRIGGERLNEQEKRSEKKGKNDYLNPDNDHCNKKSAKSNNHCLKDMSCGIQKVNSSSKCSRVLLNSDQNSKIITKSAVNGIISDLDVRIGHSKGLQKSKNKSVDIVNQSLRSTNGLKLNGDLSIEESPQSSPFTSTVTRTRKNNDQSVTRNRSSKRHLDFSSISEETILKTFLQGDEEFQILEGMSIENVNSSNSSEDSKKENVSINTSTSSNSHTEVKTQRRIRRKHTLSPDSGSPKRKILRSNQKRTLRSAV